MEEAGFKLLPILSAAVFTGHSACLGGVDAGYQEVMPGSRGAISGLDQGMPYGVWIALFLASVNKHQIGGCTSRDVLDKRLRSCHGRGGVVQYRDKGWLRFYQSFFSHTKVGAICCMPCANVGGGT